MTRKVTRQLVESKEDMKWLALGMLRIPSSDTIARAFWLLEPKAAESAFRAWIGSALRSFKQVAIDGETLRGSNIPLMRKINLNMLRQDTEWPKVSLRGRREMAGGTTTSACGFLASIDHDG